MERQRNKPVKYNRELVHKSVKAMQKIEEVKFASLLFLRCVKETNKARLCSLNSTHCDEQPSLPSQSKFLVHHVLTVG